MKFSHMLILALGLAVAYYFIGQRREESAKRATTSGTTQTPQSKSVCAQCSGLGKLVDATGIKNVGYRCPICSGRGTVTVTSGKMCNYCRGFGRVSSNHGKNNSSILSDGGGGGASSKRVIAQRCPICEGSGITPKPVN